MGLPGSGDRGHQNIIDADMEQCRKNDQIVNGGQCRAVLPFVDGLGRIEAENHLRSWTESPAALRRFTMLAPVRARSITGIVVIPNTSFTESLTLRGTKKPPVSHKTSGFQSFRADDTGTDPQEIMPNCNFCLS